MHERTGTRAEFVARMGRWRMERIQIVSAARAVRRGGWRSRVYASGALNTRVCVGGRVEPTRVCVMSRALVDAGACARAYDHGG
jgi:hypothetical protein